MKIRYYFILLMGLFAGLLVMITWYAVDPGKKLLLGVEGAGVLNLCYVIFFLPEGGPAPECDRIWYGPAPGAGFQQPVG